MLTIIRETSKGTLEITVDCGELSAKLGGRPTRGSLSRLAKPADINGRRAVAVIDGNIAVFADEYEQIVGASKLFDERAALVSRADYGDEFPGSPAYRRAQAAEAELAAFDAAHPEIKSALETKEADRLAAQPKRWI